MFKDNFHYNSRKKQTNKQTNKTKQNKKQKNKQKNKTKKQNKTKQKQKQKQQKSLSSKENKDTFYKCKFNFLIQFFINTHFLHVNITKNFNAFSNYPLSSHNVAPGYPMGNMTRFAAIHTFG